MDNNEKIVNIIDLADSDLPKEIADLLRVPSPISDTIISAIFTSVERAGMAAASLIGAILVKEGIFVGEVIHVSTQKHSKAPGERGSRVDIYVKTDEGEHILVEVQLSHDSTILARNHFATSRLVVETSEEGDSHKEMAARIPKTIFIDILNYNVRKDNDEVIQPIKMMYTKNPIREAYDKFSIYQVILPKFRKLEPDFADPFYSWLYILDTANQKKLSIEEVIDMTPELKDFTETNQGFKQFRVLYNQSINDKNVRDDYYAELMGKIREWGIQDAARSEGREEGREEGIEEGLEKGLVKGREEGVINIARNMLNDGVPIETVAKYSNLSIETIRSLSD